MGTSDGISTEDWDVLHGLAVDVVNAPDGEKEPHKHQLLRYLDTLEARYGPLPSILSTRADYLEDDDPAREGLLLQAHELAEARSDTANCVEIAESLADFYLEKGALPEANRWLGRMREHLPGRASADCSEHEFLMARYRKLAITLTRRGDE